MINYRSQSKNQEIEAKFPIGDKAQLRERILALGAELRIDEVYELNYILDRDAAPLQDSYQRLRLRLQGSVATLTYKRSLKKIEGIAFREEVETEVSDFENTRLILAAGVYDSVHLRKISQRFPGGRLRADAGRDADRDVSGNRGRFK